MQAAWGKAVGTVSCCRGPDTDEDHISSEGIPRCIQSDKANRVNHTNSSSFDVRISIYKAIGTDDKTVHTEIDKCDCKSACDCTDSDTFRVRRASYIGRTLTDTSDRNQEP